MKKLIIVILAAINLLIIGVIIVNYNNTRVQQTKISLETNEKHLVNIDTSKTALKLNFEWINGSTNLFSFEDLNLFFGTKLSIKYPVSMTSSPGDKKRTIRKFGILDEDGNQFRCVVNFQPSNDNFKTLDEKKEILSKENEMNNLNQLKPLLNKFEIIDIEDKLIVANEPACYSEYYFQNAISDGSEKIFTVCRMYSFFYCNGIGTIQFYLDSKNQDKEYVIDKFKSYRPIINGMTNSLELYK